LHNAHHEIGGSVKIKVGDLDAADSHFFNICKDIGLSHG
jgi:hypothetical protein